MIFISRLAPHAFAPQEGRERAEQRQSEEERVKGGGGLQLFKGCLPHPHWPLVWLTSNEPGEIYGLPRPRVVALVNYAKKATLGSCFGFVLICVSLVFGSAKTERKRYKKRARKLRWKEERGEP